MISILDTFDAFVSPTPKNEPPMPPIADSIFRYRRTTRTTISLSSPPNSCFSMKQAAIALLAGLLCLGSPTAQADSPNPFGFETNTHPLEYEYCKKMKGKDSDSHFWYECSSAPRMHPDIEQIHLKFVEGAGLCMIGAGSFGIKKTISLDGFKDQIAKTYGPPTSKMEDKYKPGYVWGRKEGFSGLGDVVSIMVYKKHWGGHYRVNLLFLLVPDDECEKAITQKRTEAF